MAVKRRRFTRCARRAGEDAPLSHTGHDMYGRERRQSSELDTKALREGLTAAQLNALETLEHIGWMLRFVRKTMFRDPIPVLFHRDGKRYVVLEADGTLDETPDLVIRD